MKCSTPHKNDISAYLLFAVVSTDWLYLCLSSVLYSSTLVLSTTSTPVQSGPNTISCFSTSSPVLLHVCGLPSSRISTVGIYSKTDSRKSVPDITQETCDPKYIEILESTTEYTEQKCPKQQYSSTRYQVVPLLPWLCDTNSRESAGEAATTRTSQLKKLTSRVVTENGLMCPSANSFLPVVQ